MSKRITSFLFIAIFFQLPAQDKIYTLDKIIQPVKVFQITFEDIYYKPLDNLDGPLFSIYKKDVFKIEFSNATITFFNPELNPGILTADTTSILDTQKTQTVHTLKIIGSDTSLKQLVQNKNHDLLYQAGKKDARENYNPEGVFAVNIFLSTFFSIIGIIPAGFISSTPVKEKNLRYPDAEKLKNIHYKNGYREEAQKIKSKNTWNGVIMGNAVDIIVGVMILSKR